MVTAKLNFINLPLPRPTGADPTTKEGKIERAFQEWATQIIRALQAGSVDIPAVAVPTSAAAVSPSAAALAASAASGPIPQAIPTGPAGGDLGGTYPDPRVVKINGVVPGDIIGTNLATLYGNISAMLTNVLPPGLIFEWPAAVADIPGGFLLCDGTVYNIADYELLGTLLGSKYGGDGMTTFAVPDMAARFPFGTATDGDIGTTGGTFQHKHAAGTLAAAAQVFTGSPVAAASTNATPDLVAPDTTATGVSPVTTAAGTNAASAVTGKTDNAENGAGSTADEDVIPPWRKLAFLIKT